MTSGRLWNYYRDETDDVDDNASFSWRKTEARPDGLEQPGPDAQGNPQPQPNQPLIQPLNSEVIVLLKYLSNFHVF